MSAEIQMHFALEKGEMQAAMILIAAGANLASLSRESRTVIESAQRGNCVRELLEFLKKKGRTKIEPDCGESEENSPDSDSQELCSSESALLLLRNAQQNCEQSSIQIRSNSKNKDKVWTFFMRRMM